MKRVWQGIFAVALAFAFFAAPLRAAEPKDEVVYDAKKGKVTFKHKEHSEKHKVECKTCHHKDEPKKEATCKSCHEKATKGDTPSLKIAIHGKDNKSGTCIKCHREDTKGKAPTKCKDCHKK